jgi:lipopolysaccharide/colanic/teichoic acid biosynthesis glycosyltransferase
MKRNLFYITSKRAFDIFAGISGIIILSPLLLVTSLLIKINDGGPVFYRAARVGKHGKVFRMYKFRSMIVDAERKGPSSASSSDSRITNIGKALRKYKIDELPQLINVVRGEMSIVGPRPEERRFTDMYSDNEKIILSAKPGITDWASLWNSDEGSLLEGSDDPDKTYIELIRPKKIELQIEYVRDRNFLIDLKIIILTIKKVILG